MLWPTRLRDSGILPSAKPRRVITVKRRLGPVDDKASRQTQHLSLSGIWSPRRLRPPMRLRRSSEGSWKRTRHVLGTCTGCLRRDSARTRSPNGSKEARPAHGNTGAWSEHCSTEGCPPLPPSPWRPHAGTAMSVRRRLSRRDRYGAQGPSCTVAISAPLPTSESSMRIGQVRCH